MNSLISHYTKYNVIQILCILLFLGNIITYFPDFPVYVYYFSFLMIFIYYVLSGNMSFLFLYYPFLLVALLSIAIKDIPSFFRAEERFVSFCIMIFTLGPFVQNDKINHFRFSLFSNLLNLLLLITQISFIGYLFNLFPFDTAGYLGVTLHSMVLGPIASISMIYSLYNICNCKKYKYLWLLFLITSFLIVLLTSCRSALLSGIFGCTLFLFNYYKERWFNLLSVIFFVIVLMSITYPLWIKYADGILQKNEYAVSQGTILASRLYSWEDRLMEIRENPLLGSGFAGGNLKYVNKSLLSMESGFIEAGSGWLYLASSIGLVGFFAFLIPFIYQIKKLYSSKCDLAFVSFLIGLIFFFISYIMVEGTITGSGNFFFAIFWLLLLIIHKV